MFSIVFLWIKRSAKIINYKGILCMKLQYISYFGFFCEFITIGTIDVGETWLTHRVSAYTFYFFTFPILGLLTIVIRNMRKHENNFLNPFSYYSKVVMALYLLALNSFSLGVIVFFPVKKAIVIAIN